VVLVCSSLAGKLCNARIEVVALRSWVADCCKRLVCVFVVWVCIVSW